MARSSSTRSPARRTKRGRCSNSKIPTSRPRFASSMRSTSIPAADSEREPPLRSTPGRSHFFVRATSRWRALWPRLASCKSSRTWPRASCSISRTGTVVVGQDVQISTVAVTYGTLTVRVNEQPQVSQPNPFANGRTVVTPKTTINAEQTGGPIAIVGGSKSAHAGRGPQSYWRQAAGYYRHPSGDQDGWSASG